MKNLYTSGSKSKGKTLTPKDFEDAKKFARYPKPKYINKYKDRIIKVKCIKCGEMVDINERHRVDYPEHCAECAAFFEL